MAYPSFKKPPYYLIAFRLLLAILWTRYTILEFVRVIISRLPVIGFVSEMIIPAVMITCLIIALPWFAKNIRAIDMLLYFGLAFLVLITMIIFPNNAEFISENWFTLLIGSAALYFVGLSYSHTSCSRDLYYCSVAGVFFMFLYQIYKLAIGLALEQDNMYVAYHLMPSVMYLFYYAIYKDRRKYWIIAFAALVLLFIYGTRGPILCTVVFIVLYFLHKTVVSNNAKNYWLLVVAVAVLIFLIVNEDLIIKIVSFIASVFARFGFSTRIFDFFIAGDATISRGREYLREEIITAIINNPIIGYGFTGDQYLLGVYCHNLFLELWCHFGIIGGSVILVILFGLTMIALGRSRGKRKIYYLVLMLISMVYVKLMLSSSYTIEPYFYFMLGIFVGIKRKCVPLNDVRYSPDDEY